MKRFRDVECCVWDCVGLFAGWGDEPVDRKHPGVDTKRQAREQTSRCGVRAEAASLSSFICEETVSCKLSASGPPRCSTGAAARSRNGDGCDGHMRSLAVVANGAATSYLEVRCSCEQCRDAPGHTGTTLQANWQRPSPMDLLDRNGCFAIAGIPSSDRSAPAS